MPSPSKILLNINSCRVMTAIAVMSLGPSDSPLWWMAAAPWFLINLPGLLLLAIPGLVLGLGLADTGSLEWIGGAFLPTVGIVVPTVLSILLSHCWRPLLNKTGALSHFYYPES